MSSFLSSTATFVRRLLTDPDYYWALAALVIVGDAVLTQLIVRFVPCEISARDGLRSRGLTCLQTRRSTGRRTCTKFDCISKGNVTTRRSAVPLDH